MKKKPFVWQMIKEAVEALDGTISYSDIKAYIWNKYGDVNENTINAQIIICTVNHPSRIHYPENKKPRLSDAQYDFLFTIGRGQVENYDPLKHGMWEIRKNEYGKLKVVQAGIEQVDDFEDSEDEIEELLSFPFETHLRDFIAKNIESISVNDRKLHLYIDETNRDGIEYPTDVGPIDILAVDEQENMVVFELKLNKGADRTVGQVMRYMGWVQKHLANGKPVSGVIVAQQISEKLKYAVSIFPMIDLFEYEIGFTIKPTGLSDKVN